LNGGTRPPGAFPPSADKQNLPGGQVPPSGKRARRSRSASGFLLDIAVYKGGERLYIVALNYRYSEKEES
jgi:hypothetical protein